MSDMIIHSHSTLPPILTTPPCDYRGTTGLYWPATPEGAKEALAYHAKVWSDRPADDEVAALANLDPTNE